LALSFVGLVAATVPILITGAASADYAPDQYDIVGVGGDTPQYALSFALDGDTNGNSGFNESGNRGQVIAFGGTADANGRQSYANNSTTSSPVPLNPTVVLKTGEFPVQRVTSSGAGINALLADQNTGSNEKINYVFSASLPTAAQQTQAGTEGFGFLHVVQFATDSVQIAVNGTATGTDPGGTNAPASGLTAAELLSIYTGGVTQWSQLPGNSTGSTATIIPLLPPSTSSVYKTFLADLKTANGGTAPTLSASVQTVEQNDPTAITSLGANAPNAIVPFSTGRLALWNSGYFYDPTKALGAAGSPYPIPPATSTALAPHITLLTATGDYKSPITDYIIFRNVDLSSTTPFQQGSPLNWVQTLFSDPSSPGVPYFAGAGAGALIAEAGVTWSYVDNTTAVSSG